MFARLGRLCFEHRRMVLMASLAVPATMTLLGDADRWGPPLLRRLCDRSGMHEQPAPQFAPPAEDAPRVAAVFDPGG